MKATPAKINDYVEELKRTIGSWKPHELIFSEFLENYSRAFELRELILTAKAPEEFTSTYKQLGMSNYVVNLVTSLELFLKQLIISFKDKWKDEGLQKLLTEKITLNDAFTLCRDIDIEKVNLIAYNSSFQSIEQIDSVFSKLVGDNFLDNVKMEMLSESDGTFELKDWRGKLVEVFSLRHKIIHEGRFEIVTAKDVNNSEVVVVLLAVNIYEYLKQLPSPATK